MAEARTNKTESQAIPAEGSLIWGRRLAHFFLLARTFWADLCQSRGLSAVFVFVFDRCHQINSFLFYIVFNGDAGVSGNHENSVKPMKRVSRIFIFLKRGSRPGPTTKQSRAFPAEKDYRGSLPVTRFAHTGG